MGFDSAPSDDRSGFFITDGGAPEGGKILASSMLDGFNRFTHLYSFEEGAGGPGSSQVKLSDMSIKKNPKLSDIRSKLRKHASLEPSIRVEDSHSVSLCNEDGGGHQQVDTSAVLQRANLALGKGTARKLEPLQNVSTVLRSSLRGQSITSATSTANPFEVRSLDEKKHYLEYLSN